MAFLNSLVGAFHNITVNAPADDLWAWFILDVFDFIVNYGWRVVLFTLILKLLLSPVDIMQKISMRKQQKVQAKLAPVFEKIDQQYANDQRTAMQKKQEMQKKMGAGMNPLLTCLPTLITLVIFITLFSTLQNIGAYKNLKQYVDLYNEYQNVTQCVQLDTNAYLDQDGTPSQERIDEYQQFYVKGLESYVFAIDTTENPSTIKTAYESASIDTYQDAKAFVDAYVYPVEQNGYKAEFESFKISVGQQAVHALFGETVEGFMWIKNIWAVDAMWTAPVNNYESFAANIRYKTQNAATGCACNCSCAPDVDHTLGFNQEIVDSWGANAETERASAQQVILSQTTYEKVMGALLADDYYSKNNGYLVLPILSILLALANQFLTQLQQKRSGQELSGQSGMTMKMMMWMMPITIGMFAFMNVAAFALYLVVSYLVSLIVSVIMMFIYYMMDKKMDDDDLIHTYGRPNFNK